MDISAAKEKPQAGVSYRQQQPMIRTAPLSPSEQAPCDSQRCQREEVSGFPLRGRSCALAEMVSWVVSAPPEGVTVCCSKSHVTPLGSPEHAKLTGESNPFSGVNVTVSVPWPPELTVSEGDEVLSTKLGCEFMV